MTGGTRLRAFLPGLLGLFLNLLAPVAMAEVSEEDRVKAAVVIKLARFVAWPEPALPESADLNLCLLGDMSVNEVLVGIEGQSIRQHALKIRKRLSTDGAFGECHILFIDGSETIRMEQILRIVAGRAILTISEMPDFARRGGMIELVKEGNHLGFRIHPERAKKAGLSVSSQLLGLSKIVE